MIIAAVLISMAGICQEKEDLRGFVFPDFEQGRVTMLSGDIFTGYMNYDAMYQAMIMRLGDGKYWYIPADETEIAVIGNRIFLPGSGKKEFYEEIALSGDKARRMYVQHITAFEIAGVYGANKSFAADNISIFSSMNTNMVRTQGGLSGHGRATVKLDENKNTQQVDKSLFFVKAEDGQYKLITSAKNLVRYSEIEKRSTRSAGRIKPISGISTMLKRSSSILIPCNSSTGRAIYFSARRDYSF